MFLRKSVGVIIVLISIFTSGCSSYLPGRLPSSFAEDYPNVIVKNNVSVAVKIFTCNESREAFDCELCDMNIQPIFIAINNKSNQQYSFKKEDINLKFIESKDVAKMCARSWFEHFFLWPPVLVRSRKINREMREDFIEKEIKDSSILPKTDLTGMFFVSPMKSGEKLTIQLINRETSERVVFEFNKD